MVGRPFERLLHPDEQGRLLRRLTDGAGATGRDEVIDCLLAATRTASLRQFEILHADLLRRRAQSAGSCSTAATSASARPSRSSSPTRRSTTPVTHLANRALFNERVRHAVARSLREGIGMAVVFVDLDDFKTVNDSLGHAAGDRVLLEVAQRISASIRAAYTAARFGGDEFADPAGGRLRTIQSAAETAERILETLGRPLELDHQRHRPSAPAWASPSRR